MKKGIKIAIIKKIKKIKMIRKIHIKVKMKKKKINKN